MPAPTSTTGLGIITWLKVGKPSELGQVTWVEVAYPGTKRRIIVIS